MPTSTKLLLLTATSIEAQPLIAHYRLQRDHDYHPFALYRSKDRTIWLIESGIGSLNAACAVSALFHSSQASSASVCLNIGIAGGEQALGSLWQIHKITDQAAQQHYYPTLLPKCKLASINLQTHLLACNQYSQDSLFDMEGSGFYTSASRFLVNEQIGLLKITSDNSQQDYQHLDKKQIQQLIQQQQEKIIDYCEGWRAYAEFESQFHQSPIAYADYIQQFHFSHYQQHELKRVLQQWQTLYPERDPQQATQSCSNSKAVLRTLNDRLDHVTTRW